MKRHTQVCSLCTSHPQPTQRAQSTHQAPLPCSQSVSSCVRSCCSRSISANDSCGLLLLAPPAPAAALALLLAPPLVRFARGSNCMRGCLGAAAAAGAGCSGAVVEAEDDRLATAAGCCCGACCGCGCCCGAAAGAGCGVVWAAGRLPCCSSSSKPARASVGLCGEGWMTQQQQRQAARSCVCGVPASKRSKQSKACMPYQPPYRPAGGPGLPLVGVLCCTCCCC